MNRIFVYLTALLIGGCAPLQRSLDSPASSFFRPPPGSVVELRQDLQVAPLRTRVFIQAGEVLGSGGVNTFYPSCNFELRRLSEQTQWIKAGRFQVEQVRQGSESVVQTRSIQLASLRLAGFRAFSDAPAIMRYYHFNLISEQQPEVMRLTCRGGLEDSPQADFPTWPEIQQALGPVAGFILP